MPIKHQFTDKVGVALVLALRYVIKNGLAPLQIERVEGTEEQVSVFFSGGHCIELHFEGQEFRGGIESGGAADDTVIWPDDF